MTFAPTKVLQTEIESLLKSLKKDIQNDYRAYEEDTLPGILVTIGAFEHADGSFSWGFQTGDNSYTGGAYGLPRWSVIGLYRRSNCRALSMDVAEQLSRA